MYLSEVGLCAQNMIIILSPTMNIIEGGGRDKEKLYDHLTSTIIFIVIMDKIFI